MSNVNAISALLSDFAGRIKAMEEKFHLVRERVLLLTNNFVDRERHLQKELNLLQEENKDLRIDVKRINEKIAGLISQHEDFARKEELAVVEKYFKLFNPIKFVTIEEVKELIERNHRKKGK